jgi:Protein of unknown function (DUF2924)
MPRVKVAPSVVERDSVEVEIARLRELDLSALRARWQTAFRRKPPAQLPRHILFRTLAYRLQADRVGDLDQENARLLDCATSPESAGKQAVEASRIPASIRPGTILAREWNGRMQRVTVMGDGFAWNGKTYPSLSKIAQAITGTRWNGPRFFGLRDRRTEGANA